ncbi:MAG: hypothetical protein PHX18_05885 [Candidatus Gastranaerophilales bacterium]|nr:hypothetical protein [Candidatus Gastranaerophilales bacterium]
MDQHSEDISEDMEAATQPAQALANVAGLAVGLGGAGFITYKNERRLNKKLQEFLKANSIDYTSDIYRNIEAANPKKYLSRGDLLNPKRLKKMNINIPPEYAAALQKHTKEWAKISKPLKIWRPIAVTLAVTVPIAAFVGSTLYGTKLQIDASRIARYQARKEIEDPKYSVNYTPEQRTKAKEAVKNRPSEKRSFWQKRKGDDDRKGFWKNMTGLIKDRKSYNEWKKNDTDDAKIVTRELTEQEIKQAKSDQQVIHRIVKKVNNKAEEYSENMETSAEVILSSSLLGGPVLGAISSFIVSKLGIAKAVSKKLIKSSTGSDEIVKDFVTFYAMKQKQDPDAYKAALKNLSSKLNNNIREKLRTGSKMAKLKSVLSRLSITPAGRFAILAVPTTVISMFIGIMTALKLQKAAARAGRFVAREEFKNNPQEYLSYDEKEIESVKNIKAPKQSAFNSFIEHISFLPRSVKHYFRYQEYKKTGLKEEKELKKELMKQEISEKQLKNARNLQRKVFNTFEKVDENSQKYSETMEAANQMIQPLIYIGGYAAFLSPLAVIGILVAKGKLSVGKVADKAFDMMASSSKLMKSKLFKRHLREVGNNITANIERQTVPEILQKITAALDLRAIQTSGKISASDLKNKIPVLKQIIEDSGHYEFFKLQRLMDLDDIIKLLPADIKRFFPATTRLSQEQMLRILDKLDALPLEKVPDIQINVGALKKLAEQGKNSISKLYGLNPKSKLADLVKYVDNLDEAGFNKLKGLIEAKVEKTLSSVNLENINKEQALKLVGSIESLLAKTGWQDEAVTGYIRTAREAIGKIQSNDVQSLSATAKHFIHEMLSTIQLKQIDEPKQLLAEFVRKAHKIIPDIELSSQAIFNKLKSSVNKMSDAEFAKLNSEEIQALVQRYLPKLELGKFNKKSALSIIERLEKVINNFPKGEGKAEFAKIFNKIQADPVKTYILLKENPEKLASSFMTPTLKAMLAAAGISWGLCCTFMSYLLASYFAKLEKEAGRLGVMKSLESLQDHRYYANEEVEEDKKLPLPNSPIPSS